MTDEERDRLKALAHKWATAARWHIEASEEIPEDDDPGFERSMHELEARDLFNCAADLLEAVI
jgi:hypothetical protein